MGKVGFRRWVEQHFVVVAEVIGYAVTVVLVSFLAYTLFVSVEITVTGTGTLRPVCTDVTVDVEALPVEFLVSSGQEIAAGQAVCRVVLDPRTQRRLMALERLDAASALLDLDPDVPRATLENIRNLAAALPTADGKATLDASESGWVKWSVDADTLDPVPPGEPLARIYDLTWLVVEATVPAAKTNRVIEPGMSVRVKLEDFPGPVVGTVVTVTDGEDDQRNVTARFEAIPEAWQEHFHALVFDEGADEFPPVTVEVVVGHRSLFREIFGRR